ncbi:MAG: twin-arginine translocation pathway signal [Bacteroidota bacterium]|nr:twin-arginine translocation pathway signal [Bacteroidota bacterium]
MKLNRRKFIQASGLVSAAMMIPDFLKAQEKQAEPNADKILVIIQLSGGNDGLNTVVPFENNLYYNARPQIAIRKNEVLKLNEQTGLHPAMQDFKELYDDGKLCLVNNVGYPEPDRSHFRSMDIWHTASNSNEYKSTGWIGRYLDEKCGSCDKPTQVLEIDDTLSLALKGNNVKGLALKDPKRLYGTTMDPYINRISKQHLAGDHQHDNAEYLYKTLAETISSAEYIYQTSKIYHSAASYPDHQFGKSMKTISELITSGVNTKVYYVSLGSFDTHFNQQTRQANLLKQLSETVKIFLDDLKKNGKDNDVLLMTFSEFGRRVEENASAGTDHGTANQVFLIGNGLKKKGIFNEVPNLADLDEGDLKYNIDFKNIYATITRKWLNSDDEKILGSKHAYMDFL